VDSLKPPRPDDRVQVTGGDWRRGDTGIVLTEPDALGHQTMVVVEGTGEVIQIRCDRLTVLPEPVGDRIERQLTRWKAPTAAAHPYVIIATDSDEVLAPVRSNSLAFPLTYKTARGASRGARRWHGRAWDRTNREIIR
jgi:hypothetical protein